jgi:hypothetical protein
MPDMPEKRFFTAYIDTGKMIVQNLIYEWKLKYLTGKIKFLNIK